MISKLILLPESLREGVNNMLEKNPDKYGLLEIVNSNRLLFFDRISRKLTVSFDTTKPVKSNFNIEDFSPFTKVEASLIVYFIEFLQQEKNDYHLIIQSTNSLVRGPSVAFWAQEFLNLEDKNIDWFHTTNGKLMPNQKIISLLKELEINEIL
jgi:hypothetical protein